MIDRKKDEQYHEMLNSGEMYDSVDAHPTGNAR